MSDTFTCEICRGVFEKAWTDEEAMAEAEEAFPTSDLTDTGLVCDDCYEKVMGRADAS